jgi:hypothetical protein
MSAVLALVRQLAVLLLPAAVYADHAISVLPHMVLLIVVALDTAVGAVAAGRQHPVRHIREGIALEGLLSHYVGLLSSNHCDKSIGVYLVEDARQAKFVPFQG